jgi:hypothetical protein
VLRGNLRLLGANLLKAKRLRGKSGHCSCCRAT